MPKKKQRQVDEEAMPLVSAPPVGMSEEAKAEWERLVPLGLETGLFTEADRPLLESYCEQYALVRRLEKEVANSAPTIKTSQGSSENPVWRMHRQSKVILMNMLKSLGCAPTSRQRVRPAVTSGTSTSNYFD